MNQLSSYVVCRTKRIFCVDYFNDVRVYRRYLLNVLYMLSKLNVGMYMFTLHCLISTHNIPLCCHHVFLTQGTLTCTVIVYKQFTLFYYNVLSIY